MSYRGDEQTFTDFTGGMVSNKSTHSLALNEAEYVRNIILKPGGGFRQRWGDTVYNSSTMSSGKAVTGLGYFKPASGTQYLMAICDDKIFKSEFDGTMDDITGSVTISSSNSNLWTIDQFNNLSIAVGGAPNAPIKWTGSGNATVLGGTPPQGSFGFNANNRYFIGSTSSNPSTIYWSILSNPEDWSGAGSGNATIDLSNGDILVGAAVLPNNVVLLFKERSINLMNVKAAPFPVSTLFTGIGLCGKKAVCVVNGVAFFMTPDAKIFACDGNSIINISDDDIDDILTSLNQSRLAFVEATRHTGNGFDHIIFSCSSTSATTNDIAIVYDLNNKCWLYHPTGFACNAYVNTPQKILYGGHYDGKIYKKDVENQKTDASETAAIAGVWKWGWRTYNSFMYTTHPSFLTVAFKSQSSGSLNVSYGFDYSNGSVANSIVMQSQGMSWGSGVWGSGMWGGLQNLMRTIYLKGIGNTMNVSIYSSASGEHFDINGFSIGFKRSAQRAMNAT